VSHCDSPPLGQALPQDRPSAPETSRRYLRAVDTYRIYDGTDENGIVGSVAPGLFAQEGRCWGMVYENPVGHGTHCTQPVAWVGRWKFLDGWTNQSDVREAVSLNAGDAMSQDESVRGNSSWPLERRVQ
jgi:hypothetical protein